jgi:hypothetical protein
MAIVADFLKPETPPTQAYEPAANVVSWAELENGKVVLEIFRRGNGSFGYRYQAWVAWRDAGNAVRSHSWHKIEPRSGLITDDVTSARQIAAQGAADDGLSIGEWKNAV